MAPKDRLQAGTKAGIFGSLAAITFLLGPPFIHQYDAKRSLSTTSARSAVRQPWSIIARRTHFFEDVTWLDVGSIGARSDRFSLRERPQIG